MIYTVSVPRALVTSPRVDASLHIQRQIFFSKSIINDATHRLEVSPDSPPAALDSRFSLSTASQLNVIVMCKRSISTAPRGAKWA